MSIKALIIDDEEGARESLRNILQSYFEEVEVLDTAESADDAYTKINEQQPDLIFLDIEMPRGNAFDLLERFDSIDFEIIFVTAYDHYAIKAIRFSALDYILKPIDIDELRAAIEKCAQQSDQRSINDRLKVLLQNLNEQNKPRKVAIPDSEGLIFVNMDEIIRCESDGNYTTFILANERRILASRTLGEYEDLFSDDHFFRVHRSHLINMEHITKYVKGEGGYVIMSDSSEVEVSRRKKAAFMDQLSL